mmetsp:Transcript_11045/g.20040  ORF Transcript_11045/g.20040 Transcript_11045/m.20040 type:complete len:208 (-) Transcript_11045:141-764(-)
MTNIFAPYGANRPPRKIRSTSPTSNGGVQPCGGGGPLDLESGIMPKSEANGTTVSQCANRNFAWATSSACLRTAASLPLPRAAFACTLSSSLSLLSLPATSRSTPTLECTLKASCRSWTRGAAIRTLRGSPWLCRSYSRTSSIHSNRRAASESNKSHTEDRERDGHFPKLDSRAQRFQRAETSAYVRFRATGSSCLEMAGIKVTVWF